MTGGSRGLGPYIARALAGEGAKLTLTARSAASLREVAEELAGKATRVHSITADVCDDGARRKLLEEAEAVLGPIDILVNNAGIEQIVSYTDLPPDRIEAMIDTNLVAPLILSRLVLERMIERGRGHVVMMSSLGGKKGSPYSATYAATKAGLIAWTSGLRIELQGTGVSASVICPGFVSEAGMFAERSQQAPRVLGTSTPEAVAQAVVRAIQRDVGEIIVNPGPVRLGLVFEHLSPGLARWALEKAGVYEYYRRQAEEERESLRKGS
ncbi:MAG: SDR family NAD(P)-dependent oxidoreductase [Deltaproteobacteria bacterium]|nr:SDR family NAD(P)-dependent oxidoreductase [Deltaproteobacteria bacterium]